MKLHLPNLLRKALLAALVSSISLGSSLAAAPNDLNISPGGNFWGGDFAFSFTVKEDCLSATDTSDVLALYWGTFSTSNYNSNGFVLEYTDARITLEVGDGAMGGVGESADTAAISEDTTFTQGRGATFDTILTVGSTYTILNVGADGSQTVYLVGADGSTLEVKTYNGNMNGGNADTTMGSVINADYGAAIATVDLTWRTDGISNIWGGSDANWSLSGNNLRWVSRQDARFEGAGEAVTVEGDIVVGGITVIGTGWNWGASEAATITASGTIAIGNGGTTESALAINSGVTVTGDFSLDGGTLTLGHADALGEGSTISSTSQGGTIHIAENVTLSHSKMGDLEGTTILEGNGTYDMEGNLFPTNLFASSSSWNGTVKLSGNTTGVALGYLGGSNSTIEIEGTHTLADGLLDNTVRATLTGSGTLNLEAGSYIVFQKNGATVGNKITGSGDVNLEQSTTFTNNVAASQVIVGNGCTATIGGILAADKITGHIVGTAAPATQADTDDRVVKHGTLVAATTATEGMISISPDSNSNKPTKLEDVALGATLDNSSGQLTLAGEIRVDTSLIKNFTDTSVYSHENGNGFKTKQVVYTVIQGNDAQIEGEVTWTVEGDDVTNTYTYVDGVGVGTVSHTKEKDTSSFWIQSLDRYNADGTEKENWEAIKLSDIAADPDLEGNMVVFKGGKMVFDIDTRDPEDSSTLFSFKFATNGAEIGKDEEEKYISTIQLVDDALMTTEDFMSFADVGETSESLIADGTTLLLEGTDKSFFVINDEVSLLKGLKLSKNWCGTVISSAIVGAGQGDLTSLTNGTKSTVQVGKVDTDVLTVGGNIFVQGSAALSGGASNVGGYMQLDEGASGVINRLILGSAEAAATLTVGGKLTTPDGIAYNNAYSKVTAGSITAGSIAPGTLDIWVEEPEVLQALNYRAARERVVLVELTGEPALLADEDALAENTLPTARLNESTEPIGGAADKYFSTVAWDEERYLLFTAVPNGNYVTSRCAPILKSVNGQAGVDVLGDAFVTINPQATAPDGDLASILDAVDAGAMTDKDLAAVAGASIATMGMALSGDVERQLSAIRNRTTSMGVNECVVNEGMPYFNAWVNAEGNRAELDKDGTDAGYKLDSWGGTVGFDVDLNPNFTMGMAITAMYGDLTADGPETKAEGDMDTYYVSLFARYASCAWTHTFVATVGMMDGSLDRTVNIGGFTYDTEGSVDGVTFGLLYEVGYVMPLNEEATACLQPVFNVMLRHTSIGSYTEKGSDAALDVDSQSMTTLTFGLGARMQAVVGENLYNRSSIFEARALAKVDLGDRRSKTDVGIVGGSRSSEIRSAELGAFGVELGAGLTIPLGDDDGSIFVDGAVELQSGYTNVNATVGYRINF